MLPLVDAKRIDPPFPTTDGFDALYGLEILELSAEAARGRVPVRDELRRQAGFVHGGVYGAIAEALASLGTEHDGGEAVGLSTQTTVLHPIAEGTIHASAVPKHRGRTTCVWEVELTDDEGQLCAVTRVTTAFVQDTS